MPRQKSCSVPGCAASTDAKKAVLAGVGTKAEIFTARKENRTRFAAWSAAIGLRYGRLQSTHIM